MKKEKYVKLHSKKIKYALVRFGGVYEKINTVNIYTHTHNANFSNWTSYEFKNNN